MKNRFLVINKEKIYAYIVSIMTVVTIFFLSGMMSSNIQETEEVLSNDIQKTEIGEAVSTNAEYTAEIQNKNENNPKNANNTKNENVEIDAKSIENKNTLENEVILNNEIN